MNEPQHPPLDSPNSTDAQDAPAPLEQWAAPAIERLHTGFLRRSLGMLRHPATTPAHRQALLDWVSAPLAPAGAVQPFSLQACLFFEDPRLDPETMQALILATVHRQERRRAFPKSPPALLPVLRAQGIGYPVVRVWEDGDRALERSLKKRKCSRRLCPRCHRSST